MSLSVTCIIIAVVLTLLAVCILLAAWYGDMRARYRQVARAARVRERLNEVTAKPFVPGPFGRMRDQSQDK